LRNKSFWGFWNKLFWVRKLYFGVSIICLSVWDEFGESRIKNGSKINFFCVQKTRKHVVFQSEKNARLGSENARTVHFLIWPWVFARQNVHVLFGLERWVLVLARFQMHPYELQINKPIWLDFKWAYLNGLTWFNLRKENDFETWRKWDELWKFCEMKELCETNMLWLIDLDVRWYVGIFWWWVRACYPAFVVKIGNRWFLWK